MSSDPPLSDASESDASSDPSTAPLGADLPEPYGGQALPSPPPSTAHRSNDGPPESWTKAEKDALELSDDDLDLVAGGLSTPLFLSSEQARRLFRAAARRPGETAAPSS